MSSTITFFDKYNKSKEHQFIVHDSGKVRYKQFICGSLKGKTSVNKQHAYVQEYLLPALKASFGGISFREFGARNVCDHGRPKHMWQKILRQEKQAYRKTRAV